MENILTEVRLRFIWILLGLGFTWFTCYWFPEELIFLLAKPLLTLPLNSSFVCTQLTEAFSTYLATASIASAYFVFPFVIHQIRSFFNPSCYEEQSKKYNRILYLSGSFLLAFLFLTLYWVVPNLWNFLYFMGETSNNALIIQLQPRIYDYIILTLRISFITALASQIPVIVICLSEVGALSVETFTNNRRFLMVFTLLTAALSTPPDISYQILAWLLISFILELATFVALIDQVRKQGGTCQNVV